MEYLRALKLSTLIAILAVLLATLSCDRLTQNSMSNHSNRKNSDDPHVYRVDFSDDKTWDKLCIEMAKPDEKFGFKAHLNVINDSMFKDRSPDKLKALLKKDASYPSLFFFVVDSLRLCLELFFFQSLSSSSS